MNKLSLRYNHPHQPMVYEFKDGEQLITAKNLKALVSAIRDFRRTNGFIIGDPEADLAASYLPRYEWLVEEAHEPAKAPTEALEAQGEAWAWANRLWRDTPASLRPPADKETLADIAICTTCPMNQAFTADVELTRRLVMLARGDYAELGFCRCHRWLNGLAVLLPAADIEPATDQPAECWVKTPPGPA